MCLLLLKVSYFLPGFGKVIWSCSAQDEIPTLLAQPNLSFIALVTTLFLSLQHKLQTLFDKRSMVVGCQAQSFPQNLGTKSVSLLLSITIFFEDEGRGSAISGSSEQLEFGESAREREVEGDDTETEKLFFNFRQRGGFNE